MQKIFSVLQIIMIIMQEQHSLLDYLLSMIIKLNVLDVFPTQRKLSQPTDAGLQFPENSAREREQHAGVHSAGSRWQQQSVH